MKKYLLIVLPIAFSFISSCKKEVPEFIHIKGGITNKMNGKPIKGAEIHIMQKCYQGGGFGSLVNGGRSDDFTFIKGYSGEDGKYDLNIKIGKYDKDCRDYELFARYSYLPTSTSTYSIIKIQRNENSIRDFEFYLHTNLVLTFEHISTQSFTIGIVKIIQVDPEIFPKSCWGGNTCTLQATSNAINYIKYDLLDSLHQVTKQLTDSIYCNDSDYNYFTIKY